MIIYNQKKICSIIYNLSIIYNQGPIIYNQIPIIYNPVDEGRIIYNPVDEGWIIYNPILTIL